VEGLCERLERGDLRIQGCEVLFYDVTANLLAFDHMSSCTGRRSSWTRSYVSSDISTGRSSKSVFRFATASSQNNTLARSMLICVRRASRSNLPIVALMPLPICAALRANSERALRSPLAVPLASFFCASERSEERGPFAVFCRFFACARMARNSGVLSWIEVLVIL
jgi:hypothetical protein